MPPKRPAPSDTDGLPKSAPKRARFAEPENDDRGKLSSSRTVQGNDASNEGEAFNSAQFADEVDASLDMAGKTARQKGKGAVKVEGYESDSTDDGEGVVLSRRKGQEDVDDDDMFNMGMKMKRRRSRRPKGNEILELGEIEGQEFGAEDEEDEERMDGDEDDEASVSESEPEDEDDAERRKRAGMGFEISKFNMKEEMEEGKFAEDGMKKKKDAKLKKKQTGDDVPMGGTKDPKPTSSDIDRLTALASALIVDDPDVYSNTYEGILRSVRRSGTVPQDWVPPQPQYEYCWAQTDASNGAADTVYGPFPARDMQQWYEASFFGLSGEKIRAQSGTSEWQAWDDVFA
ncbi:SubName: Full=Uncharacterized protein {ECO:0000313/EMBL:CCA71518.1} [Serendipita indica DSM 11827]|nr:SubName: Full=Uncharacterized protein {ECO:0000313/EMBL:CCA71518.1} [Serendipita indica DSM 11827]